MPEYTTAHDLEREIADLERRILDQETAMRVNRSSISVGGLTITGGALRLRDGGDLSILGGGNLDLNANSDLRIGSASIRPFKLQQLTRSNENVPANDPYDYTTVVSINTPRPYNARAATMIITYEVSMTANRPGHRQESYCNTMYNAQFSSGEVVNSRIIPAFTRSYSGNTVTQFATGNFVYYYDGSALDIAPVWHNLNIYILASGVVAGSMSATGSMSITVLWHI